MAQRGLQVDLEQFCCSICLDLLKHPVTVPCGHNYCSVCIDGYWSQDDQIEKFSCPQCRRTYNPRPVLGQNHFLADLMDMLKKTARKGAAPPDHCHAGPGNVDSDLSVEECKSSDVVSNSAERLPKMFLFSPHQQGIQVRERSTRALPEPRTRAEFLEYACPITMDPNTANRYLCLSNDNRKVTKMKQQQHHPTHPERFIGIFQVLSKEGLTGRCYWEVEWSGTSVTIAVSYKGISRDYPDNRFGNGQSWALQHWIADYQDSTNCVFSHNNKGVKITSHVSSKIGVYLDHSAGILSFYSVASSTMTLLHSVQTTFTQPLHVGFQLSEKTTVELCSLF